METTRLSIARLTQQSALQSSQVKHIEKTQNEKAQDTCPRCAGAYQRNDLSDPRFLHLPIHRKALGNSLLIQRLNRCASTARSAGQEAMVLGSYSIDQKTNKQKNYISQLEISGFLLVTIIFRCSNHLVFCCKNSHIPQFPHTLASLESFSQCCLVAETSN